MSAGRSYEYDQIDRLLSTDAETFALKIETRDGGKSAETRWLLATRADIASIRAAFGKQSEAVTAVAEAIRGHFLAASHNYDRCVCDGWVEGDNWDDHIALVAVEALSRKRAMS